MRVNVRIFGEISEIVGGSHHIELEENSTVLNLVKIIAEKAGQTPNGYLGEYKVGEADLAVIINGKNISLLNGVNTELSDQDDVVIMPFVFGG